MVKVLMVQCHGCGESGHEAWECNHHSTFLEWREHFESLPNNYTLKTTKAIHLHVNEPFIPPRSPHNLMQECLYKDPWKILVCCMCLNATSGLQARKVLLDLFAKYPTPQSLLAGDINGITEVVKPLGLWHKRPQALLQMTQGFLESDWTEPKEIFGLGKYANDAYMIFCCGRWQDIRPRDYKLNDYIKFINHINGIEYKEDDKVKLPKRMIHPQVKSKFFKKLKLNDENEPPKLNETSSPYFSKSKS